MLKLVLSLTRFVSFYMMLVLPAFVVFSMAAEGSAKAKVNTNDLLHKNLKLKSFRHKILSNNIANINTPAYKAEEIVDAQSNGLNARSFGKLPMAKTAKMHLGGNHNNSGGIAVEKLKDPEEVKPNGNNVSLSQQLVKLSQNQTDYDISLQSYKANSGLVASILGK